MKLVSGLSLITQVHLAEEDFCFSHHMTDRKREGSCSVRQGMDCSKITFDHDTQKSSRRFAEGNFTTVIPDERTSVQVDDLSDRESSFLQFLGSCACLSFDQYLVNPANHVITEIERMAHRPWMAEDIARSLQCLLVI